MQLELCHYNNYYDAYIYVAEHYCQHALFADYSYYTTTKGSHAARVVANHKSHYEQGLYSLHTVHNG